MRAGWAECVTGRRKIIEARERLTLSRALFNKSRRLPTLPRSYPRSTIGSSRLNFRVRDGNGCDPADKITGKVVKQLSCETTFGL